MNEEFKISVLTKYSIIVLLVFIAIIIINPFHSVPTGSRGVITQFGKIVGIEQEGLVILPPWKSLNNFSVRAEQADIENANGSTKDQQIVTVSLTVRYSIVPDKVAEVYEKYSHDGNLASYIQTASAEVFKAVTAKYTAPDLINNRQKVSSDIYEALRAKIEIYGAQIINIDMRDFGFSQSYMAAVNEKVTQEQKKLAADNKLKTVESEQKQVVAIAEAEARAERAKADGTAYAEYTLAEAKAKALKVQGEALVQNPSILELKRIEVELAKANTWNGQLPSAVYAGAPIPFMNVK
jgi:prohibitin 2